MRCLSLSGGGYQGLFTALLLRDLEDDTGPLSQNFDVFAGTSVGAILASAAAVGMPMAALAEVFEKEGAKIFSDRPPPLGRKAVIRDFLRYVNTAKYDAKHLSVVVRSYCGDMRMRDVPSPLLVTAVRLRDGHPVLFTRETHPDTLLREAVLASAAAPMIFPPVLVDGDLHADGAVFANCPDALALEYLTYDLNADPQRIQILGVGAMNQSPPLMEPKDPNMGVLAWVGKNRIFRTLISSQSGVAERTVTRALKERYIRIDAAPGDVGEGRIGLDIATRDARDVIHAAAAESAPHIKAALHTLCQDSQIDEPRLEIR